MGAQLDSAFCDILRAWFAAELDAFERATAVEGLAAEARSDLRASLVARLSDVAAPTLLHLFDAHRSLPPAVRLLDRTPANAPRSAYRGFVQRLQEAGIDATLQGQPLLARALRRIVADWRSAMDDFLRHLVEDGPALMHLLSGDTGALPAIASAHFGLSDPHGGGRTVGRIGFANGIALAYKPRSLAPEAAFSTLLQRISREPGAPRQRVLEVLDRGDHGWMEWIEPAPCLNAQEAEAHYRRCGGLLAVLRSLRGADIHPDNLIAAGAWPAIVDLECLFQPPAEDLGIEDPLLDPVAFVTGILPVYTSFDGGQTMVPVAAAGLAEVPVRRARGLCHVDTDWVHFGDAVQHSFEAPGPSLDGVALDVRDFAGPFVTGYRETLAVLSGPAGILQEPIASARFRPVAARFLAAPTNLYALLLDSAVQPGALADETSFNARLARAAERSPLSSTSAWQSIVDAEAGALRRLDIPMFRFAPTSRDAQSAEGAFVADLFARPIFDRVTEEARARTPAGIAGEAALIEAALRRPAPEAEPDPAAEAHRVLRQLAERVGDLSAAVEFGVDWARMWEQVPGPVAPAGPSLCYGGSGIALALAEAARALDDVPIAGLAVLALGPLEALIEAGRADWLASRIGVGWGRGAGGTIAALCWCAGLLERPALIDMAEALAQASATIVPRMTGVPDLLGGTAGLAVGLAVLREHRPDVVPAMMEACGEAILRASSAEHGVRHWPDRRRAGLAGLSHGASGFAVALAHIHVATGAPHWANAACEALAYEDRLFDPVVANWRDPGEAAPRTTWCHGAPGIALARQAVADMLGERAPDQAGAIERAIDTTRARSTDDIDDLCCGEAGRIEILMALAAHRGDDALGAEAGRALAARLPDWSAGRVRLMARQAGAPDDPALYRGLGGPMHLLVRSIAPQWASPCLLPLSPSRR